jgi:cysteine-rich repeat protein
MSGRLAFIPLALVLAGCSGGDNGPDLPRCGDGVQDPGEECDDGNIWNNDGCSSRCMLEISHTVLTANVGINRGIVPDYADGDACQSVAKYLVIDGTDPTGAPLARQEVDCAMGYNGWPFFDVPPGQYTLAMQLFDVDGQGNRVALTEPKVGGGEVRAGNNTTLYVDFTYQDFTAAYTGNLRWQGDWQSAIVPDGGVPDGGLGDGGVGTGTTCAQAQPPVVEMRFVLKNDQGLVVHDQATLNTGSTTYTTPTDGSQKVACHDYGTSDAETVRSLPWGVYRLTVEGFDAGGAAAYCAQRDIFAPKGEGIIFRAHARPGTCP